MSSSALILFAHGARDPEWAAPIERVRKAILAQAPARRVELAFLEFMSPSLADAVAGLHAEGVRSLVVVPMFIAQGGHLKRDVPQMLESLRLTYPDLEMRLTGVVGEAEGVVAAMAAFALEQVPEKL